LTTIDETWMIHGAILLGLSYALSAWAMRVNHYFSSIVRIQDERGQVVCHKGPPQRHPPSRVFQRFPLLSWSAVGFGCRDWFCVFGDYGRLVCIPNQKGRGDSKK